MGEASGDTKREIEQTRAELATIIGELSRRVQRSADIPRQAARHPYVVGAVCLGAVAVGTYAGYHLVEDRREQNRPLNRARRRAMQLADTLGERWSEAQDRMPVRVSVRAGRAAGDDDEDDESGRLKKEPGMVKKLLWTGLVAGCMALGGLLARRLSAKVWESVMHESPPTKKV